MIFVSAYVLKTLYLSWGFEAKPDIFVVAGDLFFSLLGTFSSQHTLFVLEDGGLLLVILLGLKGKTERQG